MILRSVNYFEHAKENLDLKSELMMLTVRVVRSHVVTSIMMALVNACDVQVVDL